MCWLKDVCLYQNLQNEVLVSKLVRTVYAIPTSCNPNTSQSINMDTYRKKQTDPAYINNPENV